MFRKERYDHKVDIWSIGIIAYEIIFGGMYFIGKNRWEIQDQIMVKPFLLSSRQIDMISTNYYDLMMSCLIKKPRERIDVD
jgi:serine/threonine protein kinase